MFAYGAVAHWYPYPFVEASTLGTVETLLNLFCLLSIFLIATAMLIVVDRAHPGGRAGAARKEWVAVCRPLPRRTCRWIA
jgi:hypothetical protein